MTDEMPSPLEEADATRDKVVRLIFALGLLFLLLIGFIEAVVFSQPLREAGLSAKPMMLVGAAIGAIPMLLSLWTLVRVRTWSIRRLVVLTVVSALLAVLGWPFVIGAGH